MKIGGKVFLVLLGTIILIVISVQGYDNFTKNKRCKELGEELRLFDSYCQQGTIDSSLVSNKKSYENFMRFLINNEEHIFKYLDSLQGTKLSTHTIKLPNDLPESIRENGIALLKSCKTKLSSIKIYSNSDIQIEMLRQKNMEGKFCSIHYVLRWYKNGYYQAPVGTRGDKQFIISNNIVYHIENFSQVYFEDFD